MTDGQPPHEEEEPWEPPFDFPEEADFDYRPDDAWESESHESLNPHILSLVDRYLDDTKVEKSIREHIPLLLILGGIRIADQRNTAKPVHFYGPHTPFRYILHLTQLGGSGTGKGATVEAFYNIVGPTSDDDHPIFSVGEYKGGSLESLRGGTATVGNRRFVQFGGIERGYDGFLYVPEFTQLADLSQRSSGAIQTIIAWADTSRMTFDTISGGLVKYAAPTSLILGLQTAKVTDVENVVLGWNRRSVYDQYATPTTESILPSKRVKAIGGNAEKLAEVKGALRSVWKNWAPSAIDWGPFETWLESAYLHHLAVAQDEQMLYSLALGYHIMSGGSVAGTVTVGVSDDLHRILDQILWYKRIARISVKARTANDIMDAVKDRYLLGDGQSIRKRTLVRILAARLSIDEDLIRDTLPMLTERGILESFLDEEKHTIYRLARK